MKEEGLSRREIADRLGYKSSDYITHLLRGIRKIPKKKEEILDNLIEEKKEKVVILCKPVISATGIPFDKEEFRDLAEFYQEKFKGKIEKMVEEIKERIEEVMERQGEDKKGLIYVVFDIFRSTSSMKEIKKFYGNDVFAVIFAGNKEEVLNNIAATIGEGKDAFKYANKCLQELERQGVV